MEFLIFVLLVIILIVIVSAKGSINQRVQALEKKIDELTRALKQAPQKAPVEETIKPVAPPSPAEDKDYWKTGFEVVVGAEPVEQTPPPKAAEKVVTPTPVFEEPEAVAAFAPPTPEVKYKPAEALPPKPGFFERNPDLEKFIGENLVSKIGIAILVLAIGFFVKYAIDNEWIGTYGRVAIGIACGGILIGIAHRLQKSYHAFSSVLTGGGLAVLYFTISLAYHEYRLFGSTTAFIIMLVITAFAVMLSLIYDRQEVAIIALVGGFVSPFLASSGSNNYSALFTYLVILNAGLLVIAYHKAWRLLNLLAFLFTVLLFWTWIGTLDYKTPVHVYEVAFVFALIFYVMFFAINVAHNIRQQKRFIASDFGILLSNTSLFFSVGLYCLSMMNATGYNGLFSACMGVFNLAASFILFRNRKADINILYLLIGITLTFVSLTAPLQLEGNYITLFWASEMVLLYWLYLKSKIKLLQVTTLLIFVCMLVSLVMDWFNVYVLSGKALPVILNKGFLTSLYSAVASYILFSFLEKRSRSEEPIGFLAKGKMMVGITSFLLLYLTGLWEVIYQFGEHYPGTSLYLLYIQIYTYLFTLLLLLVFRRGKGVVLFKAGLPILSIMLFLLLCSFSFSFQQEVLTTMGALNTQFIITQMCIAALVGWMFYYLAMMLKRSNKPAASSLPTWLYCVAFITYLSVEVHLLVDHVFYSSTVSFYDIDKVFNKTGLAILWGLSSFAFMWIGMKYKYRPLRIISLTLFSITLIKLFVFDIKNIAVAGKIAAFFCLGVLLLVISFMYQRLKKIIIEDGKQTATKTNEE